MPRISDFSALIFDLDGLVLDTEPSYHAAWRAAIRQMGFSVHEDSVTGLSGMHYKDVEAQLLSWYGLAFDLKKFAEISGSLWRELVEKQGIPVKDGVMDVLEHAEKNALPVCLATNSYSVYASACLAFSGLEHKFPLRVTGDEVKQPKPAPDIYFAAADKLGADIRKCIVFEDSYPGVAAAAAAGACTVYIPSTLPAHTLALDLCHYQLDSLSDLLRNVPSAGAIAL